MNLNRETSRRTSGRHARFSEPLQQVGRTYVRDGRKRLVYFGGCDYYRLASHPRVLAALHKAVDQFGLNVAASRMTTGNHSLYETLESELAAFFGAEAAVLAPNGYLTNLAVAQALAGQFTHAFLDGEAHQSLRDAALFLKCPVTPFKHRDAGDLSRLLEQRPRSAKSLVLTDGMFPLNGALAPLNEYRQILPSSAVLLVDDAHGAGLQGRTGQGTPQAVGIGRERLIQTITFSKAFGVFGGAILGSRGDCARIVQAAALLAGSTPFPLPVAGAVRQSLKTLRKDGRIRQRLAANSEYLKQRLWAGQVDFPEFPSPIVTLRPRRPSDVAAVQRQLKAAGIHPPFIRYGSKVPEGCFRFVLCSEHSAAQLDSLSQALIACRTRLLPVV